MTSKRQKAAAERWRARVANRLAEAGADESRRSAVWLDEARRLAADLPAGERNQLFAPVREQLRNLAKQLTQRDRG